jgi:DEAD/DEAH box helicase domain-containing protein
MSEPRDLGKAVGSGDAGWFAVPDAGGHAQLRRGDGTPLLPDELPRFSPTVFLYDNYPGGIGLSEPLHARRAELVARALALVQSCACAHGCPSCVGPILHGPDWTTRRVTRRTR